MLQLQTFNSLYLKLRAILTLNFPENVLKQFPDVFALLPGIATRDI